MSTLALEQVVEFLTSTVDDNDLTVVLEAARDRRAALAKIEAAAIRVGATVMTHRLKPKYMCDQTGEVTGIEPHRGGSVARVLLDETSSARLRWKSGAARYVTTDVDTDRLVIKVPLHLLKLISPGADQ